MIASITNGDDHYGPEPIPRLSARGTCEDGRRLDLRKFGIADTTRDDRSRRLSAQDQKPARVHRHRRKVDRKRRVSCDVISRDPASDVRRRPEALHPRATRRRTCPCRDLRRADGSHLPQPWAPPNRRHSATHAAKAQHPAAYLLVSLC